MRNASEDVRIEVYHKLCWWILFDFSLQDRALKKREVRLAICEHFNNLSDEEIFAAIDVLISFKWIDHHIHNNTFEIRKEGMDQLKKVYKDCVINETTVQFLLDRGKGPSGQFCTNVVTSPDKFTKFCELAKKNIDYFMITINILLVAGGSVDAILPLAKDIINRLEFLKRPENRSSSSNYEE